MPVIVRQATREDSDQIAAIYRPIVKDTAISFEADPPGSDEMARRIESALKNHEWLVAESGGAIAGYAYATRYRERHAYRFSAETTLYMHPDYQRQGIGRALYSALFESLSSLGYHRAFAGITLPNDPSVALHLAFGFEQIGVFKEAGFKFDRWHDVAMWQRDV
jgi:L-amino acid N-acyltransferase YncA